MKKIGMASGEILVSMSKTEFKKLSRQDHNDIPDGSELDLQWLKNLIALMDSNLPQLTSIKEKAIALVTSLESIV